MRVYTRIYCTNHTKLNVLWAYPLCENARETGTGVPVPVPVLTVIDTSCVVTYALIFIMKCYFKTIFLRTYVRSSPVMSVPRSIVDSEA